MKNTSINRSSLSKINIDILAKIAEQKQEKQITGKNMEYKKNNTNNINNNVNNNNINNTNNSGKDIHDTALGVLYRNLQDNKTSRKPLIYFFVGLLTGILSTLFLTAVVFVSDKDTIENDVKTVKETIIENEKDNTSNDNEEINNNEAAVNLDLPVNESGQKTYTVKQGDTLGGIVNRLYGDDSAYNPERVEKFKKANGLKSIHSLKIGQVLVVPD